MMLPFLAAFALVFGLYHLYLAYLSLKDGKAVWAAMLCLFGLVGVGLSVGIWIARRRVVSPGQRPPA